MNLFTQAAPVLGNQYDDDRVLRSYLARVLPAGMFNEVEESLRELGRLAGGELYELQLADRLNEPKLTQWDAWGNRIDQIELTPLWRVAERIAAEHGVVATAYEQKHGSLSRVHQCALAYLFTPSTDIYSCPLAMTDGAAWTLLTSGNQELIDAAVPHLTSRDPKEFWTAGQWMTELTGGSDVGVSETIAKQDGDSKNFRLYGRKWFTSAISSQIALTLARPEGNPAGGRGQGTTDGVRNITPLLNITRLWNGISAVALMRRGLALSMDYAQKRVAFGAPLSKKPLHLDTLATLQAEFEAAFHFAFYVAELTGRSETRELAEEDALLLRLLTPVMKLTTGKQAVMVASEVLETFGGAGYVEDTGLPMLLRDSQVLPIWEGTTNVLALDTLRALQSGQSNLQRGLARFSSAVNRCVETVNDNRLAEAVRIARSALDHAANWLTEAERAGEPALESGARRFSLTLGRTMELALLIKHAQHDGRSIASARRFATSGVDLIADYDPTFL
jgi:alkylation response protein AidB-like acyl-CoA dehydrogenase